MSQQYDSEYGLWEKMMQQYILSQTTGEKSTIYSRTAVLCFLYYMEQVDENCRYLANLPDEIAKYMIISKEEHQEKIIVSLQKYQIVNVSFILKENRGRDVSAFLVAGKSIAGKYDFFCFIHDKKSAYLEQEDGEDFKNHLWDCLLSSRPYIDNILQLFIENKNLGIVVPPLPVQNDFLNNYGNFWGENYENVIDLAGKIGIDINNICKEKTPETIGNVFWCRTCSLKKLLDYSFSYTDFPEEPLERDGTFNHAVERIYEYVVKDAGYGVAAVMPDIIAAERLKLFGEISYTILQIACKEISLRSWQQAKQHKKNVEALISFCADNKYTYIYGMGKIGRNCKTIMDQYEIPYDGFLISNGENMEQELDGYRGIAVDEIKIRKEELGIVVAIGKKNLEDVCNTLTELNFNRVHIWKNV